MQCLLYYPQIKFHEIDDFEDSENFFKELYYLQNFL